MDTVQELKSRTAGSRYVELDGLRGLAAVTVLWHHFFFIYDIRPRWFAIPLVAGHQAVLLFFLLSGFVLSLPFWKHRSTDHYGEYLTRRFFRIYAPYAAAVVLAVLGDGLLGHRHLPLNAWYYWTWQAKLTPRLLFDQFLMSPGSELNTAFWSLRYEVQFSIILPFLIVPISRLRSAITLALCAAMAAAALTLESRGFPDSHYYIETLRYIPIFIIGVLLAKNRVRLHDLWLAITPALRTLFVVLCALLYWGYEHPLLEMVHLQRAQYALTVCGACGLLVSALFAVKVRAVLRHRVCEYLGRISYSLYLVHGTVLFAVVNIFYWHLSRPLMCVLFFGLSISLAHLFCIGIEEPFLRLGKELAGHTSRKSSTRVVLAE